MDKNKLVLPIVILLTAIILGAFFYASQVNKYRSLEKLQQIKIEQEKQNQLDNDFKEVGDKEEAVRLLESCFSSALARYKDTLTAWGEYGKACETSYCLEGVTNKINKAEADERQDRAECLKRYPQK